MIGSHGLVRNQSFFLFKNMSRVALKCGVPSNSFVCSTKEFKEFYTQKSR